MKTGSLEGQTSIRAIHDLPAHDSRHNFPRKLPAIEWSVVRPRPRLGGLKRPALLGVEDGDVGEVAAGQRTAAAKIKDARRACGEEFDDAGQRDLVFAVKLGNRDRQRGFESSNAEGSAFELNLF